MEYGARTGIWNILELLDNFGVKATFLVCGMTAEKYPDSYMPPIGWPRDRRHELRLRSRAHGEPGT